MTEKLNPNRQPELSERDAELLSAYLDGMLTTQEQRALEARLETDLFLRGELAAMRQTVAWMNALPTLKAPRDFTISAEDVKATVSPKVIPMQNRNLWLTASAAAIVIVIIGVAAILPQLSGGNFATTGGDSAENAADVAFALTDEAPVEEAQTLSFSVSTTDQTSSSSTTGGSSSTGGLATGEDAAGQAPEPQVESDDGDDDIADIVTMSDSEEGEDAPADTASSRSADQQVSPEDIEATATALTQLFRITATQRILVTAQYADPNATQVIGGSGAGVEPSAVQEDADDGVSPVSSAADSNSNEQTENEPPVAPDIANTNVDAVVLPSATAMPTGTPIPTGTPEPAVAGVAVEDVSETTALEVQEESTEEAVDFDEAESYSVEEDDATDGDNELAQPQESLSLVQAFRQAMQNLAQELQP